MSVAIEEPANQSEFLDDNDYGAALQDHLEYLPFDDKFEIEPANLKILKMLGEGYFGDVHLGLLNKGTDFLVAVKTPKSALSKRMSLMKDSERLEEQRRQRESLQDELKIMSFLQVNQNVVQLIGSITSSKDNFCIVIEYCDYGGLDNFLREKFKNKKFVNEILPETFDSEGYLLTINKQSIKLQEKKDSERNVEELFVARRNSGLITTSDLLWFALQISRAMSFLTENMVLHRDVALRNVLLKSDFTIRISDFGLSRRADDDCSYIQTRNIVVPFRYIAPEALRSGRFSKQSELWSFGVVLWELFTFATQQPYADIEHSNVKNVSDILDFLDSGQRLSIPAEYVPKSVAAMMTSLWHKDPCQRPSFKSCQESLHDELLQYHQQIEEVRLPEKQLYMALRRPPITNKLEETSAGNDKNVTPRTFLSGMGLLLGLGILLGALLPVVIQFLIQTNTKKLTAIACCSDSGWSLTPDQASCLMVPWKKLSWSSAEAYCRNLSANLAIINSSADNNYAYNLVPVHPSSGATSIWIGAYTLSPASGSTCGWQWVDGSSFSYQNWASGQPDNAAYYCQQTAMTYDTSQSCLGIWESSVNHAQWDDGCCSSEQFFVCQKPVDQCQQPIVSKSTESPLQYIATTTSSKKSATTTTKVMTRSVGRTDYNAVLVFLSVVFLRATIIHDWYFSW